MHYLKIGLVFFTAAALGCAQGACREIQESQKKQSSSATVIVENKIPTGLGDRMRVFKSDGSLQCEDGPGVTPEKMSSDLKEISVYKSFKMNDGLMRAQLCGTATGQVNVFEIDRSDLPKAQKLGFREWTNE
jgi:hypothetical protein